MATFKNGGCFLLLSLVILNSSCTCKTTVSNAAPAEIVSNVNVIHFKNFYPSQTEIQWIEISNIGGTTGVASLKTKSPFQVDLTELQLVKGERHVVHVSLSSLAPGAFNEVLEVNDIHIELHGTVLPIPQCETVDECHVNQFNIQVAQCENTTKPNTSHCENSCVRGTCQSGVCVGALKQCDDQNACTTDSCSAQMDVHMKPKSARFHCKNVRWPPVKLRLAAACKMPMTGCCVALTIARLMKLMCACLGNV
jgi:hypothetical protein